MCKRMYLLKSGGGPPMVKFLLKWKYCSIWCQSSQVVDSRTKLQSSSNSSQFFSSCSSVLVPIIRRIWAGSFSSVLGGRISASCCVVRSWMDSRRRRQISLFSCPLIRSTELLNKLLVRMPRERLVLLGRSKLGAKITRFWLVSERANFRMLTVTWRHNFVGTRPNSVSTFSPSKVTKSVN